MLKWGKLTQNEITTQSIMLQGSDADKRKEKNNLYS